MWVLSKIGSPESSTSVIKDVTEPVTELVSKNSRQLALDTLIQIHRGTFADVALERVLQQSTIDQRDRRLVTELVYGSIRQQRTLDALISQFSKKSGQRHPVNLQLILRLGFYQLRFLDHIPPSAAVNTTVDLVKHNGLQGLKGFVNAILRQYLRVQSTTVDPLSLPDEEVARLGLLYSYPDWMIETWLQQLDLEDVVQLCQWFNRSPSIDLRVNRQRASVDEVKTAFEGLGLRCEPVSSLPNTLRLLDRPGLIQALPGFHEGWWTIQDASAQLVSHLLAPCPNEVIADACAAPGGKTTHIAELMGDQGLVWAYDRNPSRLRKVRENSDRLRLQSIQTQTRDCTLFNGGEPVDRALVDAPCSGLGTLHRHADARWRQSPESVAGLTQIQAELLVQAAQWVKPGGVLVYSTCTLHPLENEDVVTHFLSTHPHWHIESPQHTPLFTPFLRPEGWLKVWPHHHNMDGFFMVKLRQSGTEIASTNL